MPISGATLGTNNHGFGEQLMLKHLLQTLWLMTCYIDVWRHFRWRCIVRRLLDTLVGELL